MKDVVNVAHKQQWLAMRLFWELKDMSHANNAGQLQPKSSKNFYIPTSRTLRSSFKGHSFIQKFPVFIIPGTLDKEVAPLLEKLMGIFGSSLRNLFHDPIQSHGIKWRFAVIGAKGDLKWHSKTCFFTRGYERQSTVSDAAMCHLCLAGLPGIPAEAVQEGAQWERTLHASRPWQLGRPPMLNQVPFDPERPEHLYKQDGFHNLRLGVYREFVGSTIMLLLRWNHFGSDGLVKDKLIRAHGCFKLFLSSSSKSASLRSFTPSFFQYKNRRSYPWVNAKGSDVTLLMKWLCPLLVSAINLNSDPERVEPLNLMLSTARLGVKWFDLIYKHNIFFKPLLRSNIVWSWEKFFWKDTPFWWAMRFDQEECLFGVKPKLHFQAHTLLELRLQLSRGDQNIISPILWDCQQNEDYIGRFSRMSRKHDLRVMSGRVLELWLIKSAVLERRHRDPNTSDWGLDAGKELTGRTNRW